MSPWKDSPNPAGMHPLVPTDLLLPPSMAAPNTSRVRWNPTLLATASHFLILVPVPHLVLFPLNLLWANQSDGFFVQTVVIILNFWKLVYFVNGHSIELPEFLFEQLLHARRQLR